MFRKSIVITLVVMLVGIPAHAQFAVIDPRQSGAGHLDRPADATAVPDTLRRVPDDPPHGDNVSARWIGTERRRSHSRRTTPGDGTLPDRGSRDSTPVTPRVRDTWPPRCRWSVLIRRIV